MEPIDSRVLSWLEENTDIITEVLPRIREVEEEIEEEEVIINNEQNSVSLESENECKKGVKNKKYEYRWRSTNLPEINTTFMGKVFNIPPDDVDTFTHLNYFQFFWKNSLHEVFAEQTNYTACRKLVKVWTQIKMNWNSVLAFRFISQWLCYLLVLCTGLKRQDMHLYLMLWVSIGTKSWDSLSMSLKTCRKITRKTK